MKPIIAVTTYGRFEKELANPYYQHYFSLPTLYVDAIRRAGGVPLLLPPGEEDLQTLLENVDGLLFTGGADIFPAEYQGNTNHPQLTVIDPERDKTELDLLRQVLDGGAIPTLCICRGMQLLNVALGGSLHEHVADDFPEDIHRSDDGGWAEHDVAVMPGTRLAGTMQSSSVNTYSGHHQAVKELAPGLDVSAIAADGVIEAVEYTSATWILGVQWHPEITATSDPTQQRLFDELVRQAVDARTRRA